MFIIINNSQLFASFFRSYFSLNTRDGFLCSSGRFQKTDILPFFREDAFFAQRIQKTGLARKRKTGTDEGWDSSFQDENFFFIAGYTSGGVPYGLTWEEALEDPEE